MSDASTRKWRQIATGVGLSGTMLLLALAGGLLKPADWVNPSHSATLFPAAALLGAALCGILIARGSTDSDDESTTPPIDLRSILIGIAAALYAIALPHVGLIASTTVLCIAAPLALGYRNWAGILAFLVIIIGLSWLVFIRTLKVPLPL
jgi:hypothetical protein